MSAPIFASVDHPSPGAPTSTSEKCTTAGPGAVQLGAQEPCGTCACTRMRARVVKDWLGGVLSLRGCHQRLLCVGLGVRGSGGGAWCTEVCVQQSCCERGLQPATTMTFPLHDAAAAPCRACGSAPKAAHASPYCGEVAARAIADAAAANMMAQLIHQAERHSALCCSLLA